MEESTAQLNEPSLRSKKVKFDISSDCLFCGLSAKCSQKKGDPVFQVRSFSFQLQTKQHCLQRGPADKKAEAVLGRIQAVNDLPDADALYLKQCSVNFRTTKGILQAHRPSTEASSAQRPLAPKNSHDTSVTPSNISALPWYSTCVSTSTRLLQWMCLLLTRFLKTFQLKISPGN